MNQSTEDISRLGNYILQFPNGFYAANDAPSTTVNNFFQMLPFALKDASIATGFCFSLGPFFDAHCSEFNETTFLTAWRALSTLAQVVDVYPAVFGLIEGMQRLRVNGPPIPEEFIAFLSQPTQNDEIKILIVGSLFEDLPPSFLNDNHDYYVSLLKRTLPKAAGNSAIMQLNLAAQLQHCDDLHDEIWALLFKLALNDSLIGSLSPIAQLRENSTCLFHDGNEIIWRMLKEQHDADFYLKLFRIGGLLGHDDLEMLTQLILQQLDNYVTLNEVPAAFKASFQDFTRLATQKLQVRTVKSLAFSVSNTMLYPASLIMIASLRNLFAKVLHLDDSELLVLIKSGFDSNYSVRMPLFFALKKIASSEQLWEEKDWVYSRALPVLLSDSSPMAYKCLRKLINAGYFTEARQAEQIISHDQSLSQDYFSMIGAFLDNLFTDSNLVVALIGAKIIDILTNKDVELASKCFAFETSLMVIDTDDNYEDPIFESIRPIIEEALSSDLPLLNRLTISFIAASNIEFDAKKVVAICSQPSISGFDKRSILFNVIEIYEKTRHKFKFPYEILFELIKSNDFNDQAVAMEVADSLPNHPQSAEFFKLASLVARSTQHPAVLNSACKLAATLCKAKAPPIDELDALMKSILLGRVALFNHKQAWSINLSRFKFFKFLRYYIISFTEKGKPILEQLIEWIPRAQQRLIPLLMKTLSVGIEIVNKEAAEDIWDELECRLIEEGSAIENLVPILNLIEKIMTKYGSEFYDQMAVTLERAWEEFAHKRKIRNILAPRMIRLFSNAQFTLEGNFAVFSELCRSISNEGIDLDWHDTINSFFLMQKHNLNFKSFTTDSSIVYASILIKSTSWQAKNQLDKQTLQTAHKLLKQNIKSSKLALIAVEKHFAVPKEAAERLKLLISSPLIPEFEDDLTVEEPCHCEEHCHHCCSSSDE